MDNAFLFLVKFCNPRKTMCLIFLEFFIADLSFITIVVIKRFTCDKCFQYSLHFSSRKSFILERFCNATTDSGFIFRRRSCYFYETFAESFFGRDRYLLKPFFCPHRHKCSLLYPIISRIL